MNSKTKKIIGKLFPSEVSSIYENKVDYQSHLLEQYKVYLESAESNSSRRQNANSYFVTINTALIAFLSYIHLGNQSNTNYYWLIALAGIAISFMWYRLIRSYRDLNSAKFQVLHQIEKKLPISPFDAEWEAVGRGKNSKLYLPFTNIEVGIPWVFLLLHVVAFIHSFPWEIFG
jgi:hypothetical protein